jgi:hypothetical protein
VPYAIGQASAFAYCCRQEPRLFKLGQAEVRRAAPPVLAGPAADGGHGLGCCRSRAAARGGRCSRILPPHEPPPPPPPRDPSRPQVSWLAKECFVLADKEDNTLFQKLNVSCGAGGPLGFGT